MAYPGDAAPAHPADRRPHLAKGTVRRSEWVFEMKYDGFRVLCYFEVWIARDMVRSRRAGVAEQRFWKTSVRNWLLENHFLRASLRAIWSFCLSGKSLNRAFICAGSQHLHRSLETFQPSLDELGFLGFLLIARGRLIVRPQAHPDTREPSRVVSSSVCLLSFGEWPIRPGAAGTGGGLKAFPTTGSRGQ
jgi:hypothetical protein